MAGGGGALDTSSCNLTRPPHAQMKTHFNKYQIYTKNAMIETMHV